MLDYSKRQVQLLRHSFGALNGYLQTDQVETFKLRSRKVLNAILSALEN